MTPSNASLDSQTESRILRKAVLSRFVEERLLTLFSEGKLFGTVHTCIGQELTGAVLTEFLKPGDSIFSNHRCHGHFLSRTGDTVGLFAELMGKATGVCAGKGGSQHLCKDGFYSNGLQGGIVPVSAGLALARKHAGKKEIAVVFIGDGTLGEGALYEAFNIASKWKLPLLVVLEDNGISQSTRQEETLAGDIASRATAFGIEACSGDTWDWRGLYKTAGALVERVRSGGKPGFLHIKTYRLKSHSKGDDTRPRDEVEPWEKKDPVNLVLADARGPHAPMIEEVKQSVEKAVQEALAAPFPGQATVTAAAPAALKWAKSPVEHDRLVNRLSLAFNEFMAADPKIYFFGEDVRSPYGGAFKASRGLTDRWPERAFNTPISEAAIVGVGSGLALSGHRPLVEIMFGDFIGLAFDQIVNHAAKFEDMYNNQVKVNLIVRTPMGGKRGYGPTHSQTLDRHFFGTPGLRVVALNNLMEPKRFYEPLLTRDLGPTLVIENKLLYGTFLRDSVAQGFELLVSDEVLPTAWLKPLAQAQAIDVTLLGYGGMSEALVAAAETLFEEHDLIAQVICPTQICPFDVRTHLDAIAASRFLVIAEEGQGFASFGAEVLAQIAEHRPELLARVKRVVPPVCAIPASGPLEKLLLPDQEHVVQACLELNA